VVEPCLSWIGCVAPHLLQPSPSLSFLTTSILSPSKPETDDFSFSVLSDQLETTHAKDNAIAIKIR
jgi:hypothetical protein